VILIKQQQNGLDFPGNLNIKRISNKKMEFKEGFFKMQVKIVIKENA